ncbi:MAG: carboxypeptidase-like regulatory domain-containing protein [Balneolaceae bacterium]
MDRKFKLHRMDRNTRSYTWFNILIALFLLSTTNTNAQTSAGTVTGTVIDDESSLPLISAAIYLSGTTIGIASDSDGRFTLNNVPPGIYELVVRYVGYEQLILPFEIEAGGRKNFGELRLDIETFIFDDIVVEARRDLEWLEHYSLFKRSFLGQSENAGYTEIMNPEVLEFTVNRKTIDLVATAGAELHIINHALGYELFTELVSFSYDTKNDYGAYYHRTRFVEMEPEQQESWVNNRQKTFDGSFSHFLQSLINGTADEVFNIENGEVTHVNTRHASGYGSNIKTEQWVFLVETSRKTPLLVGYRNRLRSEIDFTSLSVLLVDNYGNLMNPHQVILYGDWALERMADLLPSDFNPSGGF